MVQYNSGRTSTRLQQTAILFICLYLYCFGDGLSSNGDLWTFENDSKTFSVGYFCQGKGIFIMFLFMYARFVVITVMEGPLDICSVQILQKNSKELPTSSTNSSQIQQVCLKVL